MKIALLAGVRFPIAQPFAGGLEAQTWALAHEHRRAGCEVVLCAPASSDPSFPLIPLARATPSVGGRADLPGDDAAALRAYADAMASLAATPAGIDVLHDNSIHPTPVLLAPHVPMPVVTTLHTPPPVGAVQGSETHGPGRPTTFVAVSQFTADAWSPMVGPVRVVRNGVDLQRWQTGPGGSGAVWSGRLVPEKAPHLAIEAARHAGVPIRLAGPRHDRAYWDAEVAPRLGPDAQWVGHLCVEDLVHLIGGASVLVASPDWDEPFGLVVLEALATGTPIAAFARGGIPEIIDEASGRVAVPGDVDGLAVAIRAAMRLRRQDARRRAEEVGDARRMAAEYRDLYWSVLR